ncbi:DNA helicase/exodeoxyribonuclease V, subunit A [Rhizobium sp. RU35A]|uniref:double-strand break repair helicase AddA n=1 Tax=Rhizobium sp. RU35A TaxID=1907414 RepID=UPI0009568707|nr:double-strand break repair helicase AddA [Rhizobium sp. RU35A]SIR28936.1 DNA helicase/exodeoxyribonuclease V, subunit A [Rhizobium sp. RU35A]
MSETGLETLGEDPRRWLDWTAGQQARASDPQSSAWVSANAGSGKTHVLTQRVIRLLLSGCRPSAILCLTYTKAAASEMSNRVFQRLAEWAVLPDAELRDRIAGIEGHEPDLFKLAEARRLFAKALETPGGLKIQTIHAFCEALLHQFPLEANVAGHFSVLDDVSASALLAEARRSLLTATAMEEDVELAEAFAHVLDLGDESGLEALLSDIVANRAAIGHFLEQAAEHGGRDAVLRRAYGLAPDETLETALAAYWPLPGLIDGRLTTYLELAEAKGGAKAGEAAITLKRAIAEMDPAERARLLDQVFLTQAGKPKADSSLAAKAMLTAAPELAEAIAEARDHVATCRDRLKVVRMFAATRAALTLAERLGEDYEELKRRRSLLDFEDLINRTADLLTRDGVGAWVHYKLDQGIDHILVDEAQDTSPIQWTVIQSLAEDFFSGQSARETRRTLFAVGDEKQSIYSFQGARPERFAQERSATERRVAESGQRFHAVRLPLSFRSTADVLSAVDQVFSLEDNARGLSAIGDPVIHRSNRIGHAGAVDLWETVVPDVSEMEEDWTAPFDATPDRAPSAILAARIAHRIGELVDRETVIEKGKERLIRPGDILVLVRKRDAFVNALTRALKRRGDIPVAGADRLRLASHIAVQDLMALSRFLLQPQDDLSLAAVLKSPLFDLDEDDLFRIAALRPEATSAWQQLGALADTGDARLAAVRDRLDHLRGLAGRLSVHDFFARLLGAEGGRKRFLARLGSEAGDVLDEFLSLALDHEDKTLPGLQSFVSTLELESPEIKREQDSGRDEVRIMTVHASKGLEAPIVFLVDSGSKAFVSSHVPKFRFLTAGTARVPAWVPGKTLANALSAADEERLRQSAEEEYRRLLYVGMTRAADRLILCGYRGKRDNEDSWLAMVERALGADTAHCEPARFSGPDGEWGGYRWRMASGPQRVLKREPNAADATDPAADALPDALFRPLPPLPPLPRPLSPSGAGIMIEEEDGEAPFVSPLFGEQPVGSRALQKGRLTHRMLQMLPAFPPAEQEDAARRYLARTAGFWPVAEREALLASILGVLSHPELQSVFTAHAQAEVSIMGRLSLNGRDHAVSGRIDRLSVDTDGTVTLLDYKTNRFTPQTAETAPLSHRAQMAIYREILQPLYPGRPIRCVLVYTETTRVLVLPEAVLSRSLAELDTK